MTVQINQDPRQTLNHATKGYLRALYGLTRQLNYMCKSMWRWGCSHGAISTIVSRVINSYSCIKHEQISVSKPAMHIYVRVGIVSVCVCVCLYMYVWQRGGRGFTEGRNDQLCAGLSGGCVGVWGHVGPVCGNPALLTSHTLFSCSCKPLMPQKMLSLLWPRTAEGGGQWGGCKQGRRGLA